MVGDMKITPLRMTGVSERQTGDYYGFSMKKSDYFGYEFKMMNQFFNQVININRDNISFTETGLVADLNTGFDRFPGE